LLGCGGAALPNLCPGGYYCPNTTTAIKCPKGHNCFEGMDRLPERERERKGERERKERVWIDCERESREMSRVFPIFLSCFPPTTVERLTASLRHVSTSALYAAYSLSRWYQLPGCQLYRYRCHSLCGCHCCPDLRRLASRKEMEKKSRGECTSSV
jgi:hypothetical protein